MVLVDMYLNHQGLRLLVSVALNGAQCLGCAVLEVQGLFHSLCLSPSP